MEETGITELTAIIDRIRDYTSADGFDLEFIEDHPEELLESYIQKRIKDIK